VTEKWEHRTRTLNDVCSLSSEMQTRLSPNPYHHLAHAVKSIEELVALLKRLGVAPHSAIDNAEAVVMRIKEHVALAAEAGAERLAEFTERMGD